jgi:hypothetical protein
MLVRDKTDFTWDAAGQFGCDDCHRWRSDHEVWMRNSHRLPINYVKPKGLERNGADQIPNVLLRHTKTNLSKVRLLSNDVHGQQELPNRNQ